VLLMTPTAIQRLKALVAEHPEDPVVRVTLRDSDDHRLVFNIALESTPQPDDDIQDWEGLMVAVDKHTSGRMEGVTLDYSDAGGVKFLAFLARLCRLPFRWLFLSVLAADFPSSLATLSGLGAGDGGAVWANAPALKVRLNMSMSATVNRVFIEWVSFVGRSDDDVALCQK